MCVARAKRELVTARQQHAAREDLRTVAHRRCARDRDPVADGNGLRAVEAAIAHDADRRRLGVPFGDVAVLVGDVEDDLTVRIAPRHRFDDTGDFDDCAGTGIEQSDLAVVRVGNYRRSSSEKNS